MRIARKSRRNWLRRITCSTLLLFIFSGMVRAQIDTWVEYDVGICTLSMPANWERTQLANVPFAARYSDDSDSLTRNLRVMTDTLRQPETIEQIMERLRLGATSGYDVVGEGELAGGSRKWMWLAIKAKPGAPHPLDKLTNVDYVTLDGQHVWSLHFTVPSDQLTQEQETYEGIVRSVSIKQSTPLTATESLPSNRQQQPPPSSSERTRSEAYDSGRQVGRLTAYAMFAVVAVFGLVAFFKFLRRTIKKT